MSEQNHSDNHDPAKAAETTTRALMASLATLRPIMKGVETGDRFFRVIAGKVIKIELITKKAPIHYRFIDGYVDQTPDEITVNVDLATDLDLLDAKKIWPD